MLLPSALGCPQPRRAPLPPSLFTSPPASPVPTTTTTTHSTLLATCRALQNMLASPSAQTTQTTQLPTPPMRHAPLPSPMKLRLRSSTSRPSTAGDTSVTTTTTTADTAAPTKPPRRKKVVKKRTPPTGGPGKRRRGVEEEGPRTPKRVRSAPEMMPFGLARADFERLHDAHQYCSDAAEADALGIVGGPVREDGAEVLERDVEGEGEGKGRVDEEGEWTDEEDRVLVELVLQKLRLSRREWMDCARMVGRDRGSVGRRWRSLVGGGEVGLKRRGRERVELPGTWR